MGGLGRSCRGCGWLVLFVFLIYLCVASISITMQAAWRLAWLLAGPPAAAEDPGASEGDSCLRPQTRWTETSAQKDGSAWALSVVVVVNGPARCSQMVTNVRDGLLAMSDAQRAATEILVAMDMRNKADETVSSSSDLVDCTHLWRDSVSPVPVILVTHGVGSLRSVNRALRLASGLAILLLNARDHLPAKPSQDWIEMGLAQLRENMDLGMLGASLGSMWDYSRSPPEQFDFGPASTNQSILFLEKSSSIPFMFVECAVTGPLFLRRRVVDLVRGYDLTWERPKGQESFFHDCILSYDVWSRGYTVAVFDSGVDIGHANQLHRTIGNSVLDSFQKQFKRTVEDFTNTRFSRHRIHDYVIHLNNKRLIPVAQ